MSFVKIFIDCHYNCPLDFQYTFIIEDYGSRKDIEIVFCSNNANTTDTKDSDYFEIWWSIPLKRFENNTAHNYII